MNLRVIWTKDVSGKIIMRPVYQDEQTAEDIYEKMRGCGNFTTDVEFDLGSHIGEINKKQRSLFYAALKGICEKISDINKVYTPDELKLEVKELFCKSMLDEGVDLYDTYVVEIDGEMVKTRTPKSFTNEGLLNLGMYPSLIYTKYVNFFKDYCISHFGIDPYEDLRERAYKLDLIYNKKPKEFEW